ncbi:hypothetical protein ACJIZ3_015513 [Penstemon smallii]|uniref:Uncharacterized protein n=1 Tax=Penstemon smallii TaxID=265156 RepID=A0ABD3RUP4_9LAMI
MMDQKTWLWRKRSEKTIVGDEDEVQSLPSEKELDLQNSLKTLNHKLDSVLDECSAKDKLLQGYQKTAEDALTDKHKAEEQVLRLKQELDQVLQQKVALNSALKDTMLQLNQLRKEQDQRVGTAVFEATKEFKNAHKELEEKSSYLSNVLLVKDKLIEDLNNCKCQTEAEFEALMTRLDSVEKENAFLRYEYRSLDKELHLRNDELGYSHRSLEASQKQNLDNVKKVKKLEAECQRLRGMTRKRYCNEIPSKKLGFIVDRVKELENENNILKECLAKKEEEIACLLKAEDSGLTLSDSNEISHSHSWGPALASEMSLMDDFLEMEKLAIVAIDAPLGSSFADSDVSRTLSDLSKAIVPVGYNEFTDVGYGEKTKDSPSKFCPISGYITWKSPCSSPIDEESSNESTVRDEFRKYLGGEGPGTALGLESVQKLMLEMEKIYSNFQVEIKGLKSALKERSISSLENEIEILKETNRINEEQVENQKLINEELDTQLSVTKAKLNELLKKLSSLEVELDNKSHSCQELEETCLELHLQLESNRYSEDNEKELDNKKFQKRASLLDQMLSDDGAEVEPLKFSKSKEIISTNEANTLFLDGQGTTTKAYHETLHSMARALVIVPSKNRGKMGFLRKLILRKKKSSSKNTTLYYCK